MGEGEFELSRAFLDGLRAVKANCQVQTSLCDVAVLQPRWSKLHGFHRFLWLYSSGQKGMGRVGIVPALPTFKDYFLVMSFPQH
jgi:hypothetical protein